jgi:hypothetical protein
VIWSAEEEKMKYLSYVESLSCLIQACVICLVTVLGLSCTLAAREGTASGRQGESLLRFRLDVQQTYVIGRPVPIHFILENLSNRALYVLTWNTPLEGLKGKIFRVKRDGADILYEGRMVKRGEPERQDYMRNGPRESISATIDLSQGYNVRVAGEYQVEFVGRIQDIAEEGEALPRPRERHRSVEISGNVVVFRMVTP